MRWGGVVRILLGFAGGYYLGCRAGAAGERERQRRVRGLWIASVLSTAELRYGRGRQPAAYAPWPRFPAEGEPPAGGVDGAT